jgi:hypothetical protein
MKMRLFYSTERAAGAIGLSASHFPDFAVAHGEFPLVFESTSGLTIRFFWEGPVVLRLRSIRKEARRARTAHCHVHHTSFQTCRRKHRKRRSA